MRLATWHFWSTFPVRAKCQGCDCSLHYGLSQSPSETSQVACFVFTGDGDDFFQIHIFKPAWIKGFLSIYEVLLQLHFQHLEDWRSNVCVFSLENIVILCDWVTVPLLTWLSASICMLVTVLFLLIHNINLISGERNRVSRSSYREDSPLF